MSVRRKQSSPSLPKRSPAALALALADKLDTVDCSPVTHEEGLELGAFLRLHDDDDHGLSPKAQARLAYRNYRPVSLKIQRVFAAASGDVETHDKNKRYTLRAGRQRAPYYTEGIVSDPVVVSSADPGSDVTTRVTFKEPADFLRPSFVDLTVTWPGRGEENRCACCWRFYPT